MRVLEIGCGPGVAARAVFRRIGHGQVVAIDRSAAAIRIAAAASRAECEAGLLELRTVAIEDFALTGGEPRFDLAFAQHVGVLDGRDPSDAALKRLKAALKPHALLFVEGMAPIPARDLRLLASGFAAIAFQPCSRALPDSATSDARSCCLPRAPTGDGWGQTPPSSRAPDRPASEKARQLSILQ
ncbi:class I SAM-dependent methyltransferase [Sphingomonas koreensis]|jgi:SAM-dependent methyltransferase|uniref:Class I SAM-dependent methyltransferase n=2 Tax=Sphingomonas koreensis TaxID=93064 RepID=A0A1L6JG54_9SPHN|nr:hypothetical protein BRX40_20350 [Sphingomonas koreensis]RSU20571.1 class I SAM-dependent methyltransferase [Sphingomonas koreensis]RSU28733.1 class I SAM-dependent methyltransferase [Sphingomonas koreensis]RSU29753.1 class I SAM-dependent methyltransferase [Sphingomonas koreensis]RSU36338.1 class I SAM-dependent methyltransferase [Sphingomonas koreensis]